MNTKTIQVCAFAQEGFTRNPGTYDLMCKAVELGADVVGGIPWLERSYEESFHAIDCIFEIAKKYGKDVHFLDNTLDPNSRTIEYIALKAIKENYHGRAVISSAPASTSRRTSRTVCHMARIGLSQG